MAGKAKASTGRSNGASEALESMVNASSDAVRQSFDRAVQGYDQLAAFNKATVEALMQAANAASKGLEAINAEALAFSRQTIEESVAAAKAAIGTKSIQELIELQSDYTKQAFDSYFGEVTKIGDLMASITKEATEPLNSRVAAFVEMVQGARVA